MILKSGEEKRQEEEATVQEFKWAGSPEETLQGEGKAYLSSSEKKGFGTLQIKVSDPKAWASEIGFRSRKT